ncbi:MAG: TonB-dependent receptor [Muribaculaceae bacterium]|nr:TonB-dependent receptor [Muribaculaceae bacterium]
MIYRHSNSYRLLTLGLAVMAGALSSYAAVPAEISEADSLVARRLGEVEVTAPRKTEVTLTPLMVSVIGEEAINESAQSSLLPVLQNHVPGFFVSERGFAGYGVSGGAAGSVSIRGVGGGNKVLFMIDGMPQWAGVFGHALPDTYVANGVERVEVVRGPSSLLYGSNAMGGSVNIITARATREGLTGRSRAMFGSYSTQRFNTSVAYRRGRAGLMAAGSVDRSNGNRAGSDFWLANEYLQARYTLGRHWQAGTDIDMSQTTAHNPGTVQVPLENMWTKLTRGTASVYLRDSYSRSNGGVQAYVNWGANRVDDGNAPGASPRDYIFRSTDYNMGVMLFQTVTAWDGAELSAGVDFVHWGGEVWNVKKADSSQRYGEFRAHLNEIAGYLMLQQELLRGRLSLNAGARLQHSSQYGNEWVPQAGLILRPMGGSSVKFSFGKGFRAPNLRELYLYPPHNPDLRPEYLYNYEAELRQKGFGGRLEAGLSVYYISGRDMIQTQMTDGRPRNVNVGRFINKGLEADVTWRPAREWSVMANYSYLHTDADVLYAPKNRITFQAMFSPGRWSVTLEESSVWGVLTGGPDKSDYTLLNARASYTVGYGGRVPVTLLLKADNITGTKYEIQYGCPMPGATLIGGVEIRF